MQLMFLCGMGMEGVRTSSVNILPAFIRPLVVLSLCGDGRKAVKAVKLTVDAAPEKGNFSANVLERRSSGWGVYFN